MPDPLIAAASIASALLGALITAWLGNRKATNADVRLGLDSLRDGLDAATRTTAELTERLGEAKQQIVAIERQAYAVLSENNRFRLIHGRIPATSLEAFETLPEDEWREVLERIR